MENTNYENNVIHEDVIRRVKEQMPQEEPIYEVSELFRVFGDSSRSRIICALHIEEMCVNDLAVLLTMARQDSGFSLYAGVYLAGMLLPIGAACWSAAIISRFTFSFLALTGTAVRFVIAHFFRSLGIAACTVALAVFTWNYPIWIFATPACLMLLWSVFAETVFAKYGAAITPVTPDED